MRREWCILWSGGKDSFLAYSLIVQAPADLLLVTFVPPSGVFMCHPLGLLSRQSRMLGIEHEFVVISGANWQEAYRDAFVYLKAKYGVNRVVTGDIVWDLPDTDQYWLYRILDSIGIELVLPLRGIYAEDLIGLLEDREIRAVVTGAREDCYSDEFVGKPITQYLLGEHGFLGHNGLDICGENGEYHTTVCAYQDLVFRSDDLALLAHGQTDSMKHVLFSGVELALRAPRIDPKQERK